MNNAQKYSLSMWYWSWITDTNWAAVRLEADADQDDSKKAAVFIRQWVAPTSTTDRLYNVGWALTWNWKTYVDQTTAQAIAWEKTFSSKVWINETSADWAILLRWWDNKTWANNYSQIRFWYSWTDDYSHFITSRHWTVAWDNYIDFYTSDWTQNWVYPTNWIHALTLTNGNTWFWTTSPWTNKVYIRQDTNNRALQIYTNTAMTSASLVEIKSDNASSTKEVLQLINAWTWNSIFAQNTNTASNTARFRHSLSDYAEFARADTSSLWSNLLYRNLASTGTSWPVFSVVQDNTGDDQASFAVINKWTWSWLYMSWAWATIEMSDVTAPATTTNKLYSVSWALTWDWWQLVETNPSWVTWADKVTNVMSLSQSEYDAIWTPDSSTFYIIT